MHQMYLLILTTLMEHLRAYMFSPQHMHYDVRRRNPMKTQYLEVVTEDVEGVCVVYASANGVQFSQPVAELGGARTAELADGTLVGVRGPLRETEAPVVRPYWLVNDIEAALASVTQAGGEVAVPPMEIPGRGKFAIYLQGGNDHGLWQL
jgi:predicted enzyme related to lactoylglutathione lyase